VKTRTRSIGIALGLLVNIATYGCAGPRQFGRPHSRWLEGIPPADRAKLHAIRELVKNEPAVRSASEKRKVATHEYYEALRAAMLKRDPSLRPILEKIRTRQEYQEKANAD
jgi:hypothetical protein